MANPFTSAQAPAPSMAMQLVAPELASQQISNARLQQLALLLKEKGLADANQTQVINGWAVKQSPIEGLSRMAQLLAGTYIQQKGDSENAALQKAFAAKLMQTATGGQAGSSEGGYPSNGGADANLPPQVAQGGQGAPQGSDNYNLANLIRGQAIEILGGDNAGKNFWNDKATTDMEKQNRYLGVDRDTAQQLELAKRTKDGTQSFQPGQLNILPGGQKIVAPDFNNGIAGGFDSQGNAVVQPIRGATEAAAERAGAISAAQEGTKLMPADMTSTDGRPLGITQGEFLRGGATSAPKQLPQVFTQAETRAAENNGLPANLLPAIRQIESSNTFGATNQNRNGTIDNGIYQINSVHKGLNGDNPEHAATIARAAYEKAKGDPRLTAVYYHGGLGTDPNSAENRRYGDLFMKAYSNGRPVLQSAAEKQAALDEQKLSAGPQLAKKTKDYEVASEREAGLSSRMSKSTDLMKRLKVTEDALKEFETGGGTDARSKVAEVAQVFGLPQKVIDKVAGGDLGAMQVVRKTALQESLLQMQQALAMDSGASQRGNQMIMEEFMKSNPHLDTDPRAFEKLLNMMKDHHRSVLEESNAYFKYKSDGKDITAWPNHWAQENDKTGRVKAETTNKHPYASQSKASADVQRLLDKYK